MVPRIIPLPYRKVRRWLLRNGFRVVRQNGGHVFFEHPDGRTTVVPRLEAEDIPVGTLLAIAEEAGLDPDELRR